MSSSRDLVLDEGLDFKRLTTTGSILHINIEDSCYEETIEQFKLPKITDDFGEPVPSLEEIEKEMTAIDVNGYVKKKILQEGGGVELDDGFTVSISYSGYWEKDQEPFESRPCYKPLVVNLKDNGLLPGMLLAVKSMLVGEVSMFLMTYHVMYGEMGIPPRIKPKSSCVFYIKVIKSVITPKEGEINFSEPNIYQRVQKEAKLLFVSAVELAKHKNNSAAIQIFRKAIFMLHKCRLADEAEEKQQENLLLKFYTNLTICYLKVNQPFKACIACNEYNRISNIWNNGKMLFQNAKALRIIGDYKQAEKKLRRAIQLTPKSKEMKEELELILKMQSAKDEVELAVESLSRKEKVSKEFKETINKLIEEFKEVDDSELKLPSNLSEAELKYIREVCRKENMNFNQHDEE